MKMREKRCGKTMNKRGDSMIILIILLVLLSVSLLASYYFYMNLPGEVEELEITIDGEEEFQKNKSIVIEPIVYEDTQQFYSNTKFNHNLISYSIDSNCDEEKKERMISALNELSSKVVLIDFFESVNPDIEVSCSKNDNYVKEEHFIAGEGGAKEIIQSGDYHIITNGVILLYETPENSIKCDWSNIELHELIHVFGFNHSENPNSLMYRQLNNCNQKLDTAIVNKLKELYSEENLPDLNFENPEIFKKGIYLSFNITIRNSGTLGVMAEDINLDVYDEDELVKRFNIVEDLGFNSEDGELPNGAGVYIEIQNLRLIHRNPEKIELIIDKENNIKEINENNNIANVMLN